MLVFVIQEALLTNVITLLLYDAASHYMLPLSYLPNCTSCPGGAMIIQMHSECPGGVAGKFGEVIGTSPFEATESRRYM